MNSETVEGRRGRPARSAQAMGKAATLRTGQIGKVRRGPGRPRKIPADLLTVPSNMTSLHNPFGANNTPGTPRGEDVQPSNGPVLVSQPAAPADEHALELSIPYATTPAAAEAPKAKRAAPKKQVAASDPAEGSINHVIQLDFANYFNTRFKQKWQESFHQLVDIEREARQSFIRQYDNHSPNYQVLVRKSELAIPKDAVKTVERQLPARSRDTALAGAVAAPATLDDSNPQHPQNALTSSKAVAVLPGHLPRPGFSAEAPGLQAAGTAVHDLKHTAQHAAFLQQGHSLVSVLQAQSPAEGIAAEAAQQLAEEVLEQPIGQRAHHTSAKQAQELVSSPDEQQNGDTSKIEGN